MKLLRRTSDVFRSVLALPLLLSASHLFAATDNASLSVRVNPPLLAQASGLVVVATLSVPDSGVLTGQRVFAGVSDDLGRVSFTGLPYGIYSICAEPVNSIYVEPCRWAAPSTTHLTAQHTSDQVAINLNLGIPVDIRIDDPEQLLSSTAHPNQPDILVANSHA